MFLLVKDIHTTPFHLKFMYICCNQVGLFDYQQIG